MIKPGTLCYIVRAINSPEFVGRIVNVVGPSFPYIDPQKGVPSGGPGWVVVNAGWMPKRFIWHAPISHLRPIHGPDAEQSIRETDTVCDHDEITRRLTA